MSEWNHTATYRFHSETKKWCSVDITQNKIKHFSEKLFVTYANS